MGKKKYRTRIAFGTSRQVRIETDDPNIYGRYANGISAVYDQPNDAITIFPVEKAGSHFHVHGKVHLTSILVDGDRSEDATFSQLEPFRIMAVPEVEFSGEGDDPFIRLYLPQNRKPPKNNHREDRDDSAGRQRHPISPLTFEDMIEIDRQLDYSRFDPKVFNQLLRMTKEYAAEHDVLICVDEHGQVYGRIEGN